MKPHPKFRAKHSLAHKMAGVADPEEAQEDPKEEGAETPAAESSEDAGETMGQPQKPKLFKRMARLKK